MAERKSPVRNTEKCSVVGCSNPVERSVAREAAEEGGLDIDEGCKRAHLCKDHYREWKRVTKKEREIGSLGH
jgi:hypothetical protein